MGIGWRRLWAVTAAGCAAMMLAGCAASPAPRGGEATSSAGGGDGEALVSEKCSQCHSIDRVDAAVKSEAEWQSTVERMERNGLEVTAEERDTIVQWLAERDADR